MRADSCFNIFREKLACGLCGRKGRRDGINLDFVLAELASKTDCEVLKSQL